MGDTRKYPFEIQSKELSWFYFFFFLVNFNETVVVRFGVLFVDNKVSVCARVELVRNVQATLVRW